MRQARQPGVRVGFGVGIVLAVAVVDIRVLLRQAYTFYGIVFFLLVLVLVKGFIGQGAQRWIDLGFMQLQPSELMKPAIVLALARYFHGAKVPGASMSDPLFRLVEEAAASPDEAVCTRTCAPGVACPWTRTRG